MADFSLYGSILVCVVMVAVLIMAWRHEAHLAVLRRMRQSRLGQRLQRRGPRVE